MNFISLNYERNSPLGVQMYAFGQGKMREMRILLHFVHSATKFSQPMRLQPLAQSDQRKLQKVIKNIKFD